MTTLTIAVTKGKGTVDIDTDKLPDAVYAAALAEGLKVLVNKGMSKITKAELGDEETVKKEAMLKAASNVEAILAGTIKLAGAPKAGQKASGIVMTEARRLAKNLVKDAMKQAGIKISHVEPKEITAAANALLAEDPSIIETAKANVEARSKTPIAIDVSKLVHTSPALVAKAEAKKAAAKSTLSAKQAGMVAKAKPKAGNQPTAH